MTDVAGAWKAPVWLTNAYLQDVLQKYYQDESIKIERVDFKPASATGENYLSVMARIKIYFRMAKDKTPKELSCILKFSFESDPDLSATTNEFGLFATEMKMYDQVLPQMTRILQESGDSDKLFAETLNVDYKRSAMLMEDLKVPGYEMPNRLQGMNEEHCRLVMRKLAKFHAAAAVLNERLDGALEKYDHGIFNKHTHGFGRFVEPFVKVCADFAENCPELGSYYHDKLVRLQSHVFENALCSYNNGNTKHFLTLNHGDLWNNNVMFLYEQSRESGNTKTLKDMLFVDFQFSNWSSPAVDLFLFFNTSLEEDKLVDMQFQNKLVQCYHSILKEALTNLKYLGHVPSLHELQVQLEEGRFLAVTGVIGHQAVSTAETCDYGDFHSLIDDTERANKFRLHCYKNKRFQNVVKVMLPYFDRRGLLDVIAKRIPNNSIKQEN